jgi:UDP-2-acetamido-3-amino-2,3-dideoxy-glucuronate N-acetyltransferase
MACGLAIRSLSVVFQRSFSKIPGAPASFMQTIVEDHASIGANATILPGVRIGYGAMIGAGAVVLNDVPARSIIVGNPGRIVGYAGAKELDAPAWDRMSTNSDGPRLIQFQSHLDARGRLTAVEGQIVPFVAKRFYCIDQVMAGTARGAHSHRRCHQLLVAVAGQMKTVVDDGESAYVFPLSGPEVGLYLPPIIWSMQFGYSTGAVLLVIASEPYDPNDYITDYVEFRKLAQLHAARD